METKSQKSCLMCQVKLRESQKGFFCDLCQGKAKELLKQLGDLGFVVQVGTQNIMGDHKERRVLTIKEAGDLTGFGYKTIWKMVKDGDIKTITLKKGGQKRIPVQEIELLLSVDRTIPDYSFNLYKAMGILKVSNKTPNDLKEASKLMDSIPFLDETAKLYGFYLNPDSPCLTYEERGNVLDGLRSIFDLNRDRNDPHNLHLAQRSIHWLARSREEEFVSAVRKLYRKERNPLIQRGMMIGLIFAGALEPEEFLATFLNVESNQLLDIHTYQVRSKDVPYPKPHIEDKKIQIADNFENSLRVLLYEAGGLECNPISPCSLRTLVNILNYGKEKALKDFEKVLYNPFANRLLDSILSAQGPGRLWKNQIEKLKCLIGKEPKLKTSSVS